MAALAPAARTEIAGQLCVLVAEALSQLHDTYLRQMMLFTTAPEAMAMETNRVAQRVLELGMSMRPLNRLFATSLFKAVDALLDLQKDIRSRKAGAAAAVNQLGRIVREDIIWKRPPSLAATAVAALNKLEAKIAGEPD